MIMATMNNNHIALTMDSCFVSTLESAQTSSYDTYSGSGSSHSDAEYDVEDSTFVNHSVPFPWKLHEMLEIAEQENFTNIVSWLPDRQSFKVYQTDIFVQDIMPKYVSDY